ncbi:MAG: nucleotide sugar dehydrogenase, partial [Chloroflexi bacterium]|nr:nucleotide sugar dehydrogenase [Chloroflexota bacterium]
GATLAVGGRFFNNARVAILGYAYLEDSDDARNSPSAALVQELERRGARVAIHDPFVDGCERRLERVVAGADSLVIMVAHSAYRHLDLLSLGSGMRTRTLIDARHVFDQAAAEAAGFIYRCLGVGRT